MSNTSNGNPTPSDVTLVAGSDGTNVRTIKTDSGGAIQMDIESIIPGTGATNLGKAEDGAHTSGDVGVMALGVFNEGRTGLAGNPGDYTPLAVNRAGALQADGATASDVALSDFTAAPVAIGGRASTATPTAVSADGDAVWAWLTLNGAVVTAPSPAGLAGTSPSNDVSTAAEASSVSKASAGTVYDFVVHSSAAGYIQLHNATSLPANATVPFLTFPIAADETISKNFGEYGKRFSTGIVIAYSTTAQTLTIGGSVMLANVGYV